MNKVLGYRPRRATRPRGLCYRRSVDGNAFRSETMARIAATILERMSGDPCDVAPTDHHCWFIVRLVHDKWIRA
jgi:uncharacterized MAPEG superfamily protein